MLSRPPSTAARSSGATVMTATSATGDSCSVAGDTDSAPMAMVAPSPVTSSKNTSSNSPSSVGRVRLSTLAFGSTT